MEQLLTVGKLEKNKVIPFEALREFLSIALHLIFHGILVYCSGNSCIRKDKICLTKALFLAPFLSFYTAKTVSHFFQDFVRT
jgi:hypothetical protein